jgi:hypothetical protein
VKFEHFLKSAWDQQNTFVFYYLFLQKIIFKFLSPTRILVAQKGTSFFST